MAETEILYSETKEGFPRQKNLEDIYCDEGLAKGI